MTIEFKYEGGTKGEATQVKVSCQGDIAVLPFFPDNETYGIAWLLLQEGEEGEVGRLVPDEGPIDLEETKGVIIGFEDPESINVLLEALSAIQEKFGDGSRWRVLVDVIEERRRQDVERGGPDRDDGHTVGEWHSLIQKQLHLAVVNPPEDERERWVKVAAIATARIESIDRVKARDAADVEEHFRRQRDLQEIVG